MEGSLKGVKFISLFSEMTSRYYLKEVSGVVIQEGVMNATLVVLRPGSHNAFSIGCLGFLFGSRENDFFPWTKLVNLD